MQDLSDVIRKNPFLCLSLIIVVSFVIYSVALGAPFRSIDDPSIIIDNELIKDLANFPLLFKTSYFGANAYYRPLVNLSYMLEDHFFGLNSFFYNLNNLLLHLACVALLFTFIQKVTKNQTIAIFSALLFAVHPVHWVAVTTVTARTTVLFAFFYLSSLNCILLFRERRKGVWYGISLILFSCALLSREAAAMLPLEILSFIWIIETTGVKKKLKLSAWVAPYFVLIGGYLALRSMLGIERIFVHRGLQQIGLEVATFLRSVLTHLRLFISPHDLHFDRTRAVFSGFYDPELVLTLLVFLLLFVLLIIKRRKIIRVTYFFIAWIFIELFPVSQVVASVAIAPGMISTGEHFLYLPSVGVFVFLVFIGRWCYQKGQENKQVSSWVSRAAIFGIILFYCLATVQQCFISRNNAAMVRQSLKENPSNPRIVSAYGTLLAKKKYFPEAETYFRRAFAKDPNTKNRMRLGKVLTDQGKLWEGIQIFETIRVAGKEEGLLRRYIDRSYQLLIWKYKARLKEEPDNARLLYSLGVVYGKTERPEASRESFEKALAIDPSLSEALFNLGIHYHKNGEYSVARTYYQRLLELEDIDDDLRKRTKRQIRSLGEGAS